MAGNPDEHGGEVTAANPDEYIVAGTPEGERGYTGLTARYRNKTSPVWDMSQERVFMEGVCNQRFNFFLVFFGGVLAGAFNAKTLGGLRFILVLGDVLLLLQFLAMLRTFHKLNIIISVFIYQDWTHPASIVNRRACGIGVRWVYSIIIPLICIGTLAVVFFYTFDETFVKEFFLLNASRN